MLKALGCKLLNSTGNEVDEGGEWLIQLAAVNITGVKPDRLKCEILIASDVKNPLLGENGAAAIYGPQKGATEKMVVDLEMGLMNFVNVLEQSTQKKLRDIVGGGAAGGIAVPLIGLFNAKMVSGAELVIDLLGVLEDLKNCDLVITGEGCIDLQTCHGKGPAVIANAAHEAGIPVIAIGGSVREEASWLFDGIFSITDGPSRLEETMKNAFDLTKSLSFELGKLLKIFTK
jgi:glycerate kinase